MQNDPKNLTPSPEQDCAQADIAVAEAPCRAKTLKALVEDEAGTTTLEWLLLLGAIALPSIYIFTISLNAVVDYYRMMTTINSLPFP